MDTAAIEAIRALKHRYLRAVDLKRWDELAELLHEDAVADYGTHVLEESPKLSGKVAVLTFLRDSLDNGLITTHICGHHEITVDGNTAHGTWSLQDKVISPEHRIIIEGAAYYEDDYEYDGSRWLLRYTGYERIYECMRSFDDTPSFQLLANRWNEQQK